MSKQWVLVLAVIGGLIVGGVLLVFYGPEVEPVAVGQKAPDYKAISLATGDSVALRSHYRGHVTLLNIWATWCEPCKVEMPAMQRLYDSLQPQGFRIAAVSIDQGGPDVVRDFAHQLKLTFDLLQDRSMDIQQVYETTGVPESFLLDTTGVIMKRVIGAYDWAAPGNIALIRRLLGETPSGGAGVTTAASDAPRSDTLHPATR
ncbi:MAG TPA: TlpA disulfide reductase family protein [Gemmatimonadales bacterium]|nr:TlpA disulfide reductase family protein [Gemmatimonadales bacterium]